MPFGNARVEARPPFESTVDSFNPRFKKGLASTEIDHPQSTSSYLSQITNHKKTSHLEFSRVHPAKLTWTISRYDGLEQHVPFNEDVALHDRM